MAVTIFENSSGFPIEDSGAPVECETCPCIELGDDCTHCDTSSTPLNQIVNFAGVGAGASPCDNSECSDYWNDTEFSVPQVDMVPCTFSLQTQAGPDCDGGTNGIFIEITSTKVTVTVSTPLFGSIIFEKSISTPLSCLAFGDIPLLSISGTPACDWSSATCNLG